MRLKFNERVLRKPNVTYIHKKAVNIYIIYKLAGSTSHSDDPTLKKYLLGEIKSTVNADIDKYGCSGYEIGLIEKVVFHFQVVELVERY